MALVTDQKGSSTITEFSSCMKSLANDMTTTGKKLEDKETASYILVGLHMDFNPAVSTMAVCEPLTLGELDTQLVCWEQRMDPLHGGSSSANSAVRGGHGGNTRGSNVGHVMAAAAATEVVISPTKMSMPTASPVSCATRRATRFYAASSASTRPSPSTLTTTTSYDIDTNWYTGTDATDHFISKSDKLIVRDKYHGTN